MTSSSQRPSTWASDGPPEPAAEGSPLFDRLVLESLPGAVWAIGEDGRTTFASAQLSSLLGVPAEDLMHRPAAPFLRQRRAGSTAAATPTLLAEFRAAIDQRQCWVAYQPVTDLDGELHGVEALARWEHPIRGAIPPSEFIPVAEQHDLVGDLFGLVLTEACRDVARWRRVLPAMNVSVNLSAHQLADPQLVSTIEAVLTAARLEPAALCLEITETGVMVDPSAAVASLTRLRELGVRVAIDDFGTGYSSLLYLRQLPAQILKLDRFFVAELAEDGRDRDIVAFMINLAVTLGLTTVAEGVETADQLAVLRELGCTLTQGFYWSQARPAADIDELLTRGSRLGGSDYDENAVAGGIAVYRRPDTNPSPDARRVLLVDDSPGQRSLQRIALEGTGRFRIVGEARTGEEALALVMASGADLVLLDLAMPGRNGLEIMPELIAASPTAQIVVCSGYVSAATADTARSIGAAACLDKALSPDQLVEALDGLTVRS